MSIEDEFKIDPKLFGVNPINDGWIYVLKNGDLFKVGRTNDPIRRIKEARTWIPRVEVIGVKPFWNVHEIEITLHEGLAPFWHGGEWFEFDDTDAKDLFLEGFLEFYDNDPDSNSVDFIYWWNGSGFAEFSIERGKQKVSLKKWKKAKAYP